MSLRCSLGIHDLPNTNTTRGHIGKKYKCVRCNTIFFVLVAPNLPAKYSRKPPISIEKYLERYEVDESS